MRTTRQYWELILRKHPEITGLETEVQQALRQPESIRRSTQDRQVYLFYKFYKAMLPYHLTAVVKRLNGDGFVITCYLTDKIKEGEQIWLTSA